MMTMPGLAAEPGVPAIHAGQPDVSLCVCVLPSDQTPLTTAKIQTDDAASDQASSDLLAVNNRRRRSTETRVRRTSWAARLGVERRLNGGFGNDCFIRDLNVRSLVRSCWRHINVYVSRLGRPFNTQYSRRQISSVRSQVFLLIDDIAGRYQSPQFLLPMQGTCH